MYDECCNTPKEAVVYDLFSLVQLRKRWVFNHFTLFYYVVFIGQDYVLAKGVVSYIFVPS